MTCYWGDGKPASPNEEKVGFKNTVGSTIDETVGVLEEVGGFRYAVTILER